MLFVSRAVLQDVYSNPIAPPDGEVGEKRNLSNDDFRKLMMTPRATPASSDGATALEAVAATKKIPTGKKSRYYDKLCDLVGSWRESSSNRRFLGSPVDYWPKVPRFSSRLVVERFRSKVSKSGTREGRGSDCGFVCRSLSTSSVDKSHGSSSRSIKKAFYSKMKKEEEEREAEWAEKYRDRVNHTHYTLSHTPVHL